MKRPSIFANLVFAFVAAVFTLPLEWILQGVLPYALASRIVVVVVVLGYLFFLLRSARVRVGMPVLALVDLLAAMILTGLPVAGPTVARALALLITVNRSLLFHRSLLGIAVDGLVSASGLIFAGYLHAETSSLAMSLWGFFLVQASFVLIPPRPGWATSSAGDTADQQPDPFVAPRRQAEAALERIVEGSG